MDPLLEGLKILAKADPDHARDLNGEGFNKVDAPLGHELAKRDSLTIAEQRQAMRILKKYSQQLPTSLFVEVINYEPRTDNETYEKRHDHDLKVEVDSVRVSLSDEEWLSIAEGIIPQGICEKFNKLSKSELGVRLAEQIPRKIMISKTDGIRGILRNGEEGLLKIQYIDETERVKLNSRGEQKETEILRFRGDLGPVVRIDNEIYGLKYDLNGVKDVNNIDDTITFLRNKFSLTVQQVHLLRPVLDSFVSEEIRKGNIIEHITSPVAVIRDRILVDYSSQQDISQILKILRDFYDKASNQAAYLATLGWSLLAPLHHELKVKSKRGIQAPLIVESGKTQGGKTGLGDLYCGKGFNQDREGYFYPYQRIRSQFTLAKAWSQSNLPCVDDDMPPTWILQNKEDIKAYVQTGHFADRGRPDQTINKYKGLRSSITTINDDIRIDDDLALTLRLILLRFTEQEKKRKNLSAWNELFSNLPDGFLYPILQSALGGKEINDLLKDVEKFENPTDWVNYGIDLVNRLCEKNSLPGFPHFQSQNNEERYLSNATEIAQAFQGEWERIKSSEEEYQESDGDGGERSVKKVKYRSPIEGEFVIEEKQENKEWRDYIYFTGSAYKTLMQRQGLKPPFSNASNFLNNIQSDDNNVRVENNAQLTTKRIGNRFPKVFCISIQEFKEEKT